MNEPSRRDGERVALNPRRRRAVVEPHAERQQHVGLACRAVGLQRAGARDETKRQRMQRVDRADAAHRMRDRDLQLLGERFQLFGGARILHALADNDHRALCRQQHVDSLHHAVGVGAAARRDVGAPLLRLWGLFGGGFLEHVERHVEHDRTGAAGHHRFPRLPHHHRHLLAAGRLIHPLAHGAHRGREVGLMLAIQLLERAAAELAGRHVAGDGQERHRIEIGGGERDRQVHRTGAAGCEGRDRLAGHAVVHVGHETADALVVRRDGLDVALALEQRVDELDVAVAAQAEGVGHFLLDQVVDDDLRAIERVVGHWDFLLRTNRVMPGLVPGIHALFCHHKARRGWPGQARP